MNLVLHTDRLILAPFVAEDVDLAIEMFTDPDVLKFTGGAMKDSDVRTCMSNWVKRGSNGCIGVWCISDRNSGEKLGTAALLPMPVEEDDTDFSLVVPGINPDTDVEIGYYLKRTAWGKGYATEACKMLIRAVFEHSHLCEIVATFHTENKASRNVLKKAGFEDHGTMKCYGDTGHNFRITHNDWLKGTSKIQ